MNVKRWINELKKKCSKKYVSGGELQGSMPVQFSNGQWNSMIYTGDTSIDLAGAPKDARIEKKPVEIVGDIVTQKPEMNLNDLDGQIALVKRRMKILKYKLKTHPNDEIKALAYLEARKKYKKFESQLKWAITTNELITELCKKYKVQRVGFSAYYKCAPNEAIQELEAFMKVWEDVREDEPYIELITDLGGKEHKKDPILLAPSPFGNWFHILGAWDKEVEIVDDLVYNGK